MKNTIKLLAFFLCSFFITNVSAQKATITFRTDKDVSVRIYKPIDGASNLFFISDKLDLKPNISINYEVDISDFGIVGCNFSNGMRYNMLLQPGDHLDVNFTNKNVFFNGDNAEGQTYLNNKKIVNICFNQLGLIFKKNITNRIDFEGIKKDTKRELIQPFYDDLDSLEKEMKITHKFKTLLAKDIQYASSLFLYTSYGKLLRKGFNNFKPSTFDSTRIYEEMDALYNDTSMLNVNTMKFYYGYPPDNYFLLKYKKLDDSAKEKLLRNYDKDTFGNYPSYLLAPDYMQKILFGSTFVDQLQNMSNYFNQDLMLKYLTDKFPESEYIPIIKRLKDEQKKEKETNLKPVIIDGNTINSLKELVQTNELKGKYVFVDLWATFCIPCKYEFQFNDDLHKLLSKYSNLVQIYISTDDIEKDSIWKEMIVHYKLNSYNMRASESLQKEIRDKVYNGNLLSIPRYLLLDANATILNDNLPRPSKIGLLEEALNKVIK